MFESFILGFIQGIAEWLPVSSEGIIFLVKTNFFASSDSVIEIAKSVLFLHFGTLLAALIYFYKDIIRLFKTFIKYKQAEEKDKKELNFIIIATLISGLIGLVFMKVLDNFSEQIGDYTVYLTILIGFLLLITAYLQIKSNQGGARKSIDIKMKDNVALGVAQGFASLPGLSRSGLTVSTLLMLNFNKETALRLSFIMSIPLVLAGNIILNFDKFVFTLESFVGIITAFVFGLLTIHVFLKIARKVNFGYFVLIFGLLTIFSTLI